VSSKDGRFMEFFHVVGDILTKINVKCVINLHVALLFMCLFFWVYPMCGYNCLYVYGYFLYMMQVYVYCYFTMKSCFYIMYFSVYILCMKFRKGSVCICFNCMQFEKTIMWYSSVWMLGMLHYVLQRE
jgi:hypothetical protein